MIDSMRLRKLREDTEHAIKKAVEESLPSRFKYSFNPELARGQYWEVELAIWEDNSTVHALTCGCFFGFGSFANQDIGINQFFNNNDRLFEEFINAVGSGVLDSLIPLLKHAALLSKEGASISVNAMVVTKDEWMKAVCNECVFIIHLDESGSEKLDIGCMQSERYRIKLPNEHGSQYMRVPFDKASLFSDAERIEAHSEIPYQMYEVALSFAGEDRTYVKQVARALQEMRVRVFYDEYEIVTLWGKDLYVHLDEIYRKQAKYCVTFLSEHYKNKLWTNHERESAQARAFEERSEYILPVKLDETEIPGIRRTVGYIGKLPPKKLAKMIYEKVRFGSR